MKATLLSAGVALGLFAALVGTGGCQSIAGVEERSLDEQSQLCREYCDVITTNCAGDNAQYQTDEQCMRVCSALEPGSKLEPTGNTAACRLERAKNAIREPQNQCRLAGPGGGGGPCGSDCEAWCGLLEVACEAQFRQISGDCVETCENSLVDQGSFDLVRDYFGDTLQCRLVHTMVAFVENPEVHCTHAKFDADALCVGDGEPSCEEMCRHAQGTCRGERAVYESTEQCLAVCELFDQGSPGDTFHPTVACRTYHAVTAAVDDADFHCPHAGPTGDGMCGPDDGDVTGSCQAFCTILEAACGDHDQWEARAACEAACSTDLAGKGAQPTMPGYRVATAESGDNLHCRALHAVRALEDPAQCDAAFGAAPCR